MTTNYNITLKLPLDFRTDLRAYNIYPIDCNLTALKESYRNLLTAFICDKAVNTKSIAYEHFMEIFHYYRDDRIKKSQDKDAVKWYYHKFKKQLFALEDLLYGDSSANDKITLLTCTDCKFIIPNPSSQPNVDKCPCCDAINNIVPLPPLPPAANRHTTNASPAAATTNSTSTSTSSSNSPNPQNAPPAAKPKTAIKKTQTESDEAYGPRPESSTEEPIRVRVTRGEAKKKAVKDDAAAKAKKETKAEEGKDKKITVKGEEKTAEGKKTERDEETAD
ncbi:hypothetical protein PTNB73_02849 [Pyrenophora teres f. teres]|uniref:Uncharacterized protein n=2 Tax=Pyrenophora teres f. teres TaxID=97479 RepID=E3S0C3_PYRTT|nr:hypothetical protein PTT_15496 [Pyrenophora teres f. teres 0-1]KAE8839130.1 hypothetical protein HRS9139_03513 [Pyrenophora teres f. teres]KAE8845096.1 hypothetical protein PTNB85_03361 [Pyrenophora teres f. teres]KAE8865756.1 hypothetical protein PTNB29_02903 [Pyrenophora teres f. teres]KAE8871390.1 hypothetical protein PTNB73_02849 [Pyrenophora teres f. teres]